MKKPIAPTEKECSDTVLAAEKKGELYAYMDLGKINVYTFDDEKHTEIPLVLKAENI